jgi:hypothetical protein
MADIIMGFDLGRMRRSNHPISDKDSMVLSGEAGTGPHTENASK